MSDVTCCSLLLATFSSVRLLKSWNVLGGMVPITLCDKSNVLNAFNPLNVSFVIFNSLLLLTSKIVRCDRDKNVPS